MDRCGSASTQTHRRAQHCAAQQAQTARTAHSYCRVKRVNGMSIQIRVLLAFDTIAFRWAWPIVFSQSYMPSDNWCTRRRSEALWCALRHYALITTAAPLRFAAFVCKRFGRQLATPKWRESSSAQPKCRLCLCLRAALGDLPTLPLDRIPIVEFMDYMFCLEAWFLTPMHSF